MSTEQSRVELYPATLRDARAGLSNRALQRKHVLVHYGSRRVAGRGLQGTRRRRWDRELIDHEQANSVDSVEISTTKEATLADETAQQAGLPTPDPALKRLDRFVGTWSMEGHLVGSEEKNIKGEATYRWLPGCFFLEQRISLDFMGMQIESLELIGYDPETKTFPSTIFSNVSPTPLPYMWEVGDDTVKISVSYGPLDATFEGNWSEDGESFGGGWRPNPGADESINVPYDISGRRVK